ncbi:2-nitropropane dioxygenase [Bacteroidia bacterium]|nr:2-nitropropane dioxygenase [Bacteroidia bacterium]
MKSFFIGDIEIKLPIVQGGMGIGVSLAGLAAAVANEGGVGVISCAGSGLIHQKVPGDFLGNSIWGLQEELRVAREKTKGIIGVNIMVALSNFADMVRTCIAEKVDIIFAGAGLPLDMPSYLQPDSTTKLVPIISSARAAQLICNKWKGHYNYLPDAIVVEGPKAGGHLGFKSEELESPDFALEKIVPEVLKVAESYKDEKKIPVIAGGGIYTGKDIRKFLEMGVAAVQMSSIFVTTEECDASDDFKNTYINAKKEDMRIIHSPVGMLGRAIDSKFVQDVESGLKVPKVCPHHCIKTCDYINAPYCISQALLQAAHGDLRRGFAFAGANAYLAEKISTVKEVFDKLKAEFAAA